MHHKHDKNCWLQVWQQYLLYRTIRDRTSDFDIREIGSAPVITLTGCKTIAAISKPSVLFRSCHACFETIRFVWKLYNGPGFKVVLTIAYTLHLSELIRCSADTVHSVLTLWIRKTTHSVYLPLLGVSNKYIPLPLTSSLSSILKSILSTYSWPWGHVHDNKCMNYCKEIFTLCFVFVLSSKTSMVVLLQPQLGVCLITLVMFSLSRLHCNPYHGLSALLISKAVILKLCTIVTQCNSFTLRVFFLHSSQNQSSHFLSMKIWYLLQE